MDTFQKLAKFLLFPHNLIWQGSSFLVVSEILALFYCENLGKAQGSEIPRIYIGYVINRISYPSQAQSLLLGDKTLLLAPLWQINRRFCQHFPIYLGLILNCLKFFDLHFLLADILKKRLNMSLGWRRVFLILSFRDRKELFVDELLWLVGVKLFQAFFLVLYGWVNP